MMSQKDKESVAEQAQSTSTSRIVFGLVIMGAFFAAALTLILAVSNILNPSELGTADEDDWF
jgi:hypothetical protein